MKTEGAGPGEGGGPTGESSAVTLTITGVGRPPTPLVDDSNGAGEGVSMEEHDALTSLPEEILSMSERPESSDDLMRASLADRRSTQLIRSDVVDVIREITRVQGLDYD